MIWFYALIIVAALTALADRLLLFAERRGWIRYRQSRAAFRVSAGNALSEMDLFYNPSRRAAIELTQEEILRREDDDDGGADGGGPPACASAAGASAASRVPASAPQAGAPRTGPPQAGAVDGRGGARDPTNGA